MLKNKEIAKGQMEKAAKSGYTYLNNQTERPILLFFNLPLYGF